MKILLFILLLSTVNCSFKKNPLANQTHKGHKELYSRPDAPELTESKDVRRIVIAATNDLEAHYDPHDIAFTDMHNPGVQNIRVGGADAIAAYFKVLRDQYQDVLLVDSGDIFSSKTSIKEVQNFYKSNKYDAVTLGVNDFNQKLPKGISSSSHLFREFANSSSVPLILSNLYELKTGRVVEWKGALPYLIKSVGGVKVGIIGLIPDDIAKLTPIDNRVSLYVENMLQATLQQARLLRSLGADLIVVLTHQGLNCGHELAQESKLPLKKINFDPNQADICDLKSTLGTYLERLPPHLIDVVIGGRNHEKVANFVNDTLVLSSFEKGKSMSYAEFFFDTKTKEVIKERTIVHQPVMFCREFFKETRDCFSQDTSVNHAQRIAVTFLGQELQFNDTSDKVSLLISPEINLKQALKEMKADIAFTPLTSGSSQLINLKISGKDLIRLLEEDFNSASIKNWHPSPFVHKDGLLYLILQKEHLDPAKEYTVLTDLEGVHDRKILSNASSHANRKVLPNHSWSSFEMSDSVNTKMAAQER
jgi:2',3'-cyclic-nucleotide 2'-phosphodiesterase (5'-nucleotidase family)